MKITAIRTTALRVPFTQAARWTGGTREVAPVVLVEIETDAGITGIGECAGPTTPTIKTAVDAEFAPLLTGQDPMRTEFCMHRLEEHSINWREFSLYALSGIEMALLDIKGKALGVPVVELFGGRYRETVSWMGYIFIGTPEENAAMAASYVKRGYSELKLKVGRDPDLDVACVKLVRETVGAHVGIRVDANMAWNSTTAIKIIRQLEPYNLQYVEQPVPWRDLEGMARVRASVETPIAADESCTDFTSALALVRAQACDVFTLYVSEAGGLSRARDIIRLADNEGIQCVLGTWAELGVGTTAAIHLIASSRNFPFANDTHYEMQADDIITEPLNIVDGQTEVPRTPGLGVTLDPSKVATYASLKARETVFGDAEDTDFIPRIGQIL